MLVTYVCLLVVPLIRVSLNKRQYMHNTQDQMAGLQRIAFNLDDGPE